MVASGISTVDAGKQIIGKRGYVHDTLGGTILQTILITGVA